MTTITELHCELECEADDELSGEHACTFYVDEDVCGAEPYSWGGSRGTETVINSVTLLTVNVHGKAMDRDAVEAASGAGTADDLEYAALQRLAA